MNAFGEQDVRLLTTIARSLSVALENAGLFEETRQRAGELAIVNSVGQALAEQLEMEALIERLGDQLRDLFGADIVYVALDNQTFPLLRNTGKGFQDITYASGLAAATRLATQGFRVSLFESRQRVTNLTRDWMRKRPGRDCQEFAAIRRHGKREPLPQRLGDEWHDRVQQPQGVVESVSEHRSRNLAVVVR